MFFFSQISFYSLEKIPPTAITATSTSLMRIGSAIISVLCLFFFVLSLRCTVVLADSSVPWNTTNGVSEFIHATNENKREKTKKGRKKRNRRSPDDSVRLLVKYNANNYGKSYFTIFEGNSLIKEFDLSLSHYSVASITVSNKDVDLFQNNSDFELVEMDHEMRAFVGTTNISIHTTTTVAIGDTNGDNSSSRQLTEQQDYGISMVQANQLTLGDSLIKICVVDTGYGEGHPDLPTAGLHGVEGWNEPLGTYGKWDIDVHGHGTHVAGIIGAVGENNRGVVGVNKDPNKYSLFIAKGLSDTGTSSTSNVLAAVHQCAQNGAKVVNLSLGGTGRSVIAEEVYKDLYDQGILIFAAAGNSASDETNYPASFENVVSVSAVDSNEAKATFSQWNNQVEMVGPGVHILSTVTTNNGTNFTYATRSGTSMATPYVAGVAALVWSHFPSCSNNQIRNALIKTAKDVGPTGCDSTYGHGIVQAKDAYDLLASEGCQAGGQSPSPLSHGSLGGCLQNDNLTAPSPPPSCAKGKTLFQLALLTDDYPEETRWDVQDMTKTIIVSGSGYSSRRSYHHERHCLEDNANYYTFTIYDEFSDGICCSWGNGLYEVKYGEAFVYTGSGNFESEESFSFGSTIDQTLSPSMVPTIKFCYDNPEWTINYKGRIKTCSWVADRPIRRCRYSGAEEFCRMACGSC
mmetsp:Transcript_9640/g.13646  ORF Transcript_9640/g.13646 Transcript_9640/m.13646 type:complete len:687 (+) Transcript_9640:353-2413(+)